MPNNPVQIVLNDKDFLSVPEPGQGGPHKDFFDSDKEFQKHRARLVTSVDRVETAIKLSGYDSAYLKVQMREESLAKSYRPTKVVFNKSQFPCVGADNVGMLYFHASCIHLSSLRRSIHVAEDTVEERISKNTGEPYKATSRVRSEVGAIKSIEITSPFDKRAFSVMDAVHLFKDPKTVSGYLVELFETPTTNGFNDDELRVSLKTMLIGLGHGARTLPLQRLGRASILELQLTRSEQDAIAFLDSNFLPKEIETGWYDPKVDLDPERHERALDTLARHPLVRCIHLPIQLDLANQEEKASQIVSKALNEKVKIPNPVQENHYPVVGVVDSGVGSILDSWIIDRFDYLSQSDYDTKHGTQVAGLLTFGQRINDPDIIQEPDGCMIYDIPLYPKDDLLLRHKYPNGFRDFLQEMENAIEEACSRGVRIFNLSINVPSEVQDYSPYAEYLDTIADRHKILIVNSAGNLPSIQARLAWQSRPRDVMNYLAARTESDKILCPSESVRSVAVGALNPPRTNEITGAPTRYTTRGPGLRAGVKPDVATYGGTMNESSGLFSIELAGYKVPVSGTSFAAPQVARILTNLDAVTNNSLTLETLRAMLFHHTSMPAPLQGRQIAFRKIARQFAGFGQPFASNQMLETGDHQITMVFQSRLTIVETRPSILRFDFSWPQSLVDHDGRCSGRVRITLVSAPPLNGAYGDEFVRVNLDAKLSQMQPLITRQDGNPSYINQIKPIQSWGSHERALIEHGLKWWPAKQYESNFNSKGNSSNWRLQIESLVRAEDTFPEEGVPFAVILTIEDPDGIRPIFSEMRNLLAASGAILHDIRADVRLPGWD